MEEKGKKLGIINLMGLGLGGAIGTGIFIMMGYGIAQTGRSVFLSCIIGCFFMLLAVWYNMGMSTMFVFNAGDYGMRTMLLNPLMTGVNSWFTIVQGFALSTHAIAITSYLVIAIPALNDYSTLVSFIIITLAFLTTIRGSRFVTILQNLVTAVLVIALVLFIGFGVWQVDPVTFFSNGDGGFFRNGFGGLIGAMSTLSFACMGTTGLIAVAAVTKKPKKSIPFGIEQIQ